MKASTRASRLLALLLACVSALLILVSCGIGDVVKFEIKFMVGEEVYDTISTSGNEALQLPDNPTKDGYTFDGWYWDNNTWQTPFSATSFLNTPLTGDMKVYAKFTEIGSVVIDTLPVPNTAYKLFVDQSNASARCFLNGAVDTYYLGTTTDVSASVNVYVENADASGKYYLFCVYNGARQYINMVKNGTMYNAVYNNAPITAYSYDLERKTFIGSLDGNDLVLAANAENNYKRIGVRYLNENNFVAQLLLSTTPDTVIPEISANKATVKGIQDGAIGLYETTATVYGINERSFIIGDGTGYMLVFKSTGWTKDVALGDKLTVVGKTTVYGGSKQFNTDATYTKVGTEAVSYPTPTSPTSAELDAYSTASSIAPVYAKLRGLVEIDGAYYDLKIDGATVTGSLKYPDADLLAKITALNGKYAEVTGFITGTSGGGAFLEIMVIDMVESEDQSGGNEGGNTPGGDNPGGAPELHPEEIVREAYKLAVGETLGVHTLTGVIVSVDTPFSTQFNNVTVTIVVGDLTDKPVQAFRLEGVGADVIKVGDTITVTGTILNYNDGTPTGKVEFDKGCHLDSYVSAGGGNEGGDGDGGNDGPEYISASIEDVFSSPIGTLCELDGTVVAINAQSFLIADETGYLLVYRGSSWTVDVEIGDTLTLKGASAKFGTCVQLGASATYEISGTSSVEYGNPRVLDAEALDAFSDDLITNPEYVKATGTLVIDGAYYNLTFESAEIIGSFTYPLVSDAEALATLNGKKITVTGYVTGTNRDGLFLSIIVTDYEEFVETIEPESHEHPLVERPALEPTCKDDGNRLCYYCELCDKLFSDAEGTVEVTIEDVLLESTGDHNYVDGTCTECGEADPDYTPPVADAVTVTEALALEVGAEVKVSGTVSFVRGTWNGASVTAYLTDGENYILLYKLATDVSLGDTVTVTGAIGEHSGVKQIAAGATAEITASGAEVAFPEYTFAELEALKDGTNITVVGTVSEINSAWSEQYGNMNVYITDGEGNTLYVYRLRTQVEVGDLITIVGTKGSYNDIVQVGEAASATISEPPTECEHNYVDGACTECGEADPDYVAEMTIAEALAAENGTKVVVSGTVSFVRDAWNSQHSNMTVYITDGTDYILLYRLGTEVALGDTVTVTGNIKTYNNVNQIDQGATAEITASGAEIEFPEYTFAELEALKDGANITVVGTVSEIVSAWNEQYGNMNVYITDGEGNTLYVYRLRTQVEVGDLITIVGTKGSYNGAVQVGEAASAVKS